MDEIAWRDIMGYEGLYKISSNGDVKSITVSKDVTISPKEYRTKKYYIPIVRDKILKLYINKKGYCWVTLFKDRVGTQKSIHSLLAKAFIPNPNNYPIVRHLNDIPSDNRLDNLAWGTKSENMYDAIRNGKLKNRPRPIGNKSAKAKLNPDVLRELKEGVSTKNLGIKYGVTQSHIYDIRDRKVCKHLNFNEYMEKR